MDHNDLRGIRLPDGLSGKGFARGQRVRLVSGNTGTIVKLVREDVFVKAHLRVRMDRTGVVLTKRPESIVATIVE